MGRSKNQNKQQQENLVFPSLAKTQSGGGRLFGATYSLGKCRWLEIVQAMKSLIPLLYSKYTRIIVSHILGGIAVLRYCGGIAAKTPRRRGVLRKKSPPRSIGAQVLDQ